MATPSMSLVESLIGAIPIEEGAALVARVGERATITARSGSAEVGSVALTVEAMDDLIAQVLPPDQLESLHENGTVHFEFTPRVIGGEFAVLAASTPGDRWLEIRRRNTATETASSLAGTVHAAAPAAPPVPVQTVAVVQPVAQVTPVAPITDDAEVASLLSRFHPPEATAAVPDFDLLAPSATPAPPVHPTSFTGATTFAATDFDLSATVPTREPYPEPPAPAPAVLDASTNDDLTLPANLDFAAAKSDFDLDGLSLPDTLPDRTDIEAFQGEAPSTDSDHIHVSEPEAIGMAKSHRPVSTSSQPLRSRSVLLLSVVLGVVALGAGGWFAAQWYLTTPVDIAAPPPPRKPVQPKAAAAATTPAAKPVANAAVQKPAASTPAPKPVATPAAAKASPTPPAPPAGTPATAKTVTPAPSVTHEEFAIQVAAVHEREEADRIVARLVSEGYSGYAIRGQGAAAAYYRVRVGARDRREAEEIAARLERAEGVKPWIVKETP
jgi:cell division septation protein DedD